MWEQSDSLNVDEIGDLIFYCCMFQLKFSYVLTISNGKM